MSDQSFFALPIAVMTLFRILSLVFCATLWSDLFQLHALKCISKYSLRIVVATYSHFWVCVISQGLSWEVMFVDKEFHPYSC